jgi:tetratricopeptide (TPR) repeat protein
MLRWKTLSECGALPICVVCFDWLDSRDALRLRFYHGTYLVVCRYNLRPLKQLIWTGLLCVSVTLLGTSIEGQDAGSNAGQLWKDANAAFASGDYARSATALESIIRTSTVSATWLDNATVADAPSAQMWLEPVFFMLGAAHFNAKDWPNAILTFNKYLALFPKSPRTTQVRYSLAQADLLDGHPADAIPLFTALLPLPDYHAKSLMLLVQATEAAGKPTDAISLLEKEKSARRSWQPGQGAN